MITVKKKNKKNEYLLTHVGGMCVFLNLGSRPGSSAQLLLALRSSRQRVLMLFLVTVGVTLPA